MRREAILAGALATSVGLLMATSAIASEYTFQKVATIQLKGQKGHGDLVTFDPSNKMLYVSMPNDGLDVIDTRTNQVVAYVQNIASPNGNVADDNYVYVAAADGPGAGKVNAVAVVDKKTWKEVGRVATQGTSPDGIQLDPATHTLYVTSDDNNWIEVYSTGKKPVYKTKWALYPPNPKAGPDVGTLVPSLHTIFQPDDAWFLKVDTDNGAIVAKTDANLKLTKHGGTKGSIYDPKTGYIWDGTTNPQSGVIVFDKDMHIVKRLPTHGGIDAVAFDPKLDLVYAFGGNGRKGFDVFDAKTMQPVTFVWTHVGQTHSGDVDTDNDLVYAFGGDGGVVDVFKPVMSH